MEKVFEKNGYTMKVAKFDNGDVRYVAFQKPQENQVTINSNVRGVLDNTISELTVSWAGSGQVSIEKAQNMVEDLNVALETIEFFSEKLKEEGLME
ncbi:TPA_asm: hypothetical protein GZX72_14655 [Listeria monocytogenes]|nr:hypothetical protein [Listeria monocytogenes]